MDRIVPRALVARVARDKVTVPNLLITAALSEGSETPTQRKAAMAELMAIHTLLARVSNNVNQIARHANGRGRIPARRQGRPGVRA